MLFFRLQKKSKSMYSSVRKTINFINSSYNIYAFMWVDGKSLAIFIFFACIFQQTQMRIYYRNSENFAEALIIAESIIRLHHNHPVEHWIYDGNAGIFRCRVSAAIPSCRRKRSSEMRTPLESLSKNEKTSFRWNFFIVTQEFCCTTFFSA